MKERYSGILLHISSLSGNEPIGTLGPEAYSFVDFLSYSGQKYWQILPLGPTGFGNSPYQSFSVHAGNYLFISCDLLYKEGLLLKKELNELEKIKSPKVNYDFVSKIKPVILQKAFERFRKKSILQEEANLFYEQNNWWLNDFALFITIKKIHKEKPWYEWEIEYRDRNKETIKKIEKKYYSEIEFYKFLQFYFFKQWKNLKKYCNDKNIEIIGDIPIYTALDSSDCWVFRKYFLLDDDGYPLKVAGVPPDYFSETGQLWGNPVYNWDEHEKDDFYWWTTRIKSNINLYDVIRIDHFRGLSQYWAVPYGEKTAVNGKWFDAPGHALFSTIFKKLGKLKIIAEDLGVITEDVIKLRETFNIPGMKILQFAFDSKEKNNFLPHNYEKNCVVYTGTHDNDTVCGWFESASEQDKKFALEYMNAKAKTIHWDFIRTAWASVANIAIAPMQDILGLGKSSRMNFPGTTSGNWEWRMPPKCLTTKLAQYLLHLTKLYDRCNS